MIRSLLFIFLAFQLAVNAEESEDLYKFALKFEKDPYMVQLQELGAPASGRITASSSEPPRFHFFRSWSSFLPRYLQTGELRGFYRTGPLHMSIPLILGLAPQFPDRALDLNSFVSKGTETATNLAEIEKQLDQANQGKAAKRPWSGDYYPLFNGSVNYRYRDQNWLLSPNLEEVKEYFQDYRNFDLRTISSTESYDIFTQGLEGVQETPFSLDVPFVLANSVWKGIEVANAYGERALYYSKLKGLSWGWVQAAITSDRPLKTIAVQGFDGDKVVFKPSDLKALATLMWNQSLAPIGVLGHPSLRAMDMKSPDYTRPYPQMKYDPSLWHLSVLHKMGIQKDSFIVLRWIKGEWLNPIYKYQLRYFNVSNGRTADKFTGNEKELLIKSSVWSKQEFAIVNTPFESIFPDIQKIIESAGGFHHLPEEQLVRIHKRAVAVYEQAKRVQRVVRKNDPYILGVEMSYSFVNNTMVSDRETDDPGMDAENTVTLRYDLELDDDYNIIGGEWYTTNSPDLLITPKSGGIVNKNHQIINELYSVKADVKNWSRWLNEAGELVFPRELKKFAVAFAYLSGSPLQVIVDTLIAYSRDEHLDYLKQQKEK